jgi:hypothetical protein
MGEIVGETVGITVGDGMVDVVGGKSRRTHAVPASLGKYNPIVISFNVV